MNELYDRNNRVGSEAQKEWEGGEGTRDWQQWDEEIEMQDTHWKQHERARCGNTHWKQSEGRTKWTDLGWNYGKWLGLGRRLGQLA